jgi:hypothetical protein
MHAAQLEVRDENRSNLLFRTRRTQAIIVGLITLVSSSVLLVAQTPGHVELQGSSPLPPTTITSLTNRSLKKTHFFILGQDLAVQASCSSAGCQASAPVFTPQIQCPGVVGKTCTYHIQVSAQVSETPNDFGQYRFLVDGVPPIQFQTDFSGYFNWEQSNPNSGLGVWEARAYSVVATVKNNVANQNHSVEVDIACFDTDGDGCIGAFGFGNLRVDVFEP